MVKALVFKGDKRPKKRKHSERDIENSTQDPDGKPTKTREGRGDEQPDDDSWVTAEQATDLAGPVIIVLPSEPATCIACDATGKVFASEVENIVQEDPRTAEPHDVRQVWIANQVAGTESLSFKGHHGRYLSCDKFGILSSTREAISNEESFICIASTDTPGTFNIQTGREKFLTASKGPKGTNEVRGDAETVDFNSTVRIRMQARFKPKLKASKEEKAREKISWKELETLVGRKLNEEEVKTLKKARKTGQFSEAVLDVRVKGKSDKFA